jgi:transcriptional regulator with XRE-family HTH domain
MQVNRSLKVFRARRGLTQEQIAKRMGWSRQYYAKTENGRSTGSILFWVKLQDAFNIPDEEMWPLVKDTKE